METIRNKSRVILSALALLIAVGAMSQRQDNNQGALVEKRGLKYIPDLTEEQMSKIDDLRTSHLEKMIKQKAKVQVLQSELRELEIAENADMVKINTKIDEISALKTMMAKERSAHRQDIRKTLTKEQQLYFDNHMAHMRGSHNGHHRHQNDFAKSKRQFHGTGHKGQHYN